MTAEISHAREAYDESAWQDAFDAYAAGGALEPDDLDRFAICAHLLGRLDDYYAIRERQYHLHLDRGELAKAGHAAMWIGAQKMAMGQVGAGSGWLATAKRHVAEDGSDCVERGWVLVADFFALEANGEIDLAVTLSDDAVSTGRRFGDQDLIALAVHQRGLLLVRAGQRSRGLAALDEAMLHISSGQLSPMVTGIVYCGVIQGCWDIYELRRAQEWTSAMATWCDAQPQLANFTGECKVRRAELKALRGQWSAAHDELDGVHESDIDPFAVALAAYVRGNLDRLQGDFDAADEAFGVAARLGIDPQPGLALLRLARGSSEAAAAMVRRALVEIREPGRRVELLTAAAEIFLAVGESGLATDVVGELAALARHQASPIPIALAARAEAALSLHQGRPQEALGPLRSAVRTWLQVASPYEEARARVLLARACRELGDLESADRELDTARVTFHELGAGPDLARLDAPHAAADGLLTARELEVLRLVAAGTTNRAIAAQLVLSERTIDRHVSNIFTKLGVTSRAAATATAYERALL